jgi:uncharacterized protein (TIGR01244 family)
MQIVRINPLFSVADQIEEQDVPVLAAAGFKTVIDHRPDLEGGTPAAVIRAACARHGLKFFFQPVEFSTLTLADADTMGQILQGSDPPVLAYCRSGRRSTALWALAAAPLAGVQTVIERSQRAGVGLDELRPLLIQSAARSDPSYAPAADPQARQRFVKQWVDPR